MVPATSSTIPCCTASTARVMVHPRLSVEVPAVSPALPWVHCDDRIWHDVRRMRFLRSLSVSMCVQVRHVLTARVDPTHWRHQLPVRGPTIAS
jgi:hypothetical protein